MISSGEIFRQPDRMVVGEYAGVLAHTQVLGHGRQMEPYKHRVWTGNGIA